MLGFNTTTFWKHSYHPHFGLSLYCISCSMCKSLFVLKTRSTYHNVVLLSLFLALKERIDICFYFLPSAMDCEYYRRSSKSTFCLMFQVPGKDWIYMTFQSVFQSSLLHTFRVYLYVLVIFQTALCFSGQHFKNTSSILCCHICIYFSPLLYFMLLVYYYI